MRNTITLGLAFLVISLSEVSDSQAGFVQPTSISTTASPSLNTPAVLINAATGGGGTSYVAPDPASGGGGTSWHTGDAGTSPVTLTFDFASSPDVFLELYVWDYYFHTPTDWTLKLYSGLGQSGIELLDYDFSFIPGPVSTSTVHILDFPNVSNVLSGILETRNNSAGGGVGLAEFGFTTTIPPVPEPSTLALLGLGIVGLALKKRRGAA